MMKCLAKDFFKKSLNASLRTVRQGHYEFLYAYILSKPLFTFYETKVFHGIGYFKNRIKPIEEYRLPIRSSFIEQVLEYDFYYCIYTCNLDECNRIKIDDDFNGCEQKPNTFIFKTTMPLMRVPESTILTTYINYSSQKACH